MNKLFESNKKVTAIPDNPDALIQFYDFYFTGILRSETALRQGILPSPYQQLFEVNTGTQSFTCTFNGAQRQLIGLKFVLFLIYHFITQLFTIVMI